MAEQDIPRRALFSRGGQERFLEKVLECLSIQEIARLSNVSERTIRDWRREKFLMDFSAVRILCDKLHIVVPSEIEVKERYWYVRVGARKGALAVIEKYGRVGGDPEYRKRRWREWWEQKGRFKSHPVIGVTKPIRRPRPSRKLAEFVGIMMGDGGITKNQLRVTLNSRDDTEYVPFVKRLTEELFKIPVSIAPRKDQMAVDLVISRTELVRFCNEKLGLPIGNKIKQGLDMPGWIKEDVGFQTACLRGLVDTDGCIFNEVHHINKKTYSYQRLNFRSASPPLRNSVFSLLKGLGMNPTMRNDTAVQLENKEAIIKYFHTVKTHNPKHLRKFTEGCSEWQGTGLENRRPQGLVGSSPTPSAFASLKLGFGGHRPPEDDRKRAAPDAALAKKV